jgi:GNAT superfamily N-acetyltransferase
MDELYQITYVEKPEEAAWGIIGTGLDAYNVQQAGDYHFQRICFTLQDEQGQIAGGVLGEMFWDYWFHVDLMWVKEELRGQGYGQRLLAAVEEEARRRGAKFVFLDTFSFQAPEFYKKYGYQVFGELPDFPPGHKRYFLTKQL